MQKLKRFMSSLVFGISCALGLWQSAQADEHAKPQIPVFYFDLGDALISSLSSSLEARVQDYPFSLEKIDCQNNAALQLNRVRAYLNSGGHGPLLVNLVDPRGGDMVSHAIRRAQKPVIFFNRRPAGTLLNSFKDSWYVGVDAQETAVKQAEILIEAFKANPGFDKNGDGVINTACLKGEFSYEDTDLRTVAFLGKVRSAGIKLNLVMVKNGDWNFDKAYAEVKKYLAKHSPDKLEMIFANNDSMALGALKALQEAGYNTGDSSRHLPILGIDGLPEMIAKIKQGQCLGTVNYDTDLMSEVILRLAAGILDGREPDLNLERVTIKNHNVYVGSQIITRESL